MADLIDKLTTYNLFNYLLPGTIFAALATTFTEYALLQDDLLVAFFVYYFAGLIISRIGSLGVEPVLKKLKVVTYAPYEDYVTAAAADPRLDTLSEVNNTYRTIVSMLLCLAALKCFEVLVERVEPPSWIPPVVLMVFLFVLFLLSYRKQTSYIYKRINTRGGSE